MTPTAARLDHAVINALYDMDAAVERFRSLGFTVTPRGYHSLGSINHLMVFNQDYVELVGVERGAQPIRREVADSPAGLNGLVFRTFDADACHAALTQRGIAAESPLSFSRPVIIEGREEVAAFRTVRLKPGVANGGRVYFCEHLTPQFVWRREWQAHSNGVDRICEFTFVVPDPEREAATYGHMLDLPVQRLRDDDHAVDVDGLRVRCTTGARHRERFGTLAGPAPGRDCYMAALAMHTTSMKRLREYVENIAQESSDGAMVVPAIEAFGVVIEFMG